MSQLNVKRFINWIYYLHYSFCDMWLGKNVTFDVTLHDHFIDKARYVFEDVAVDHEHLVGLSEIEGEVDQEDEVVRPRVYLDVVHIGVDDKVVCNHILLH